MANHVGCDYCCKGSISEQVKGFTWQTGQKAAIACVVSSLFLFLMGEEDIVPGVINGAATAFSIGVVDKAGHIVLKDGSDETIKKVVLLVSLVATNYFAVTFALKKSGYNLPDHVILQQTAISYLGIYGMAYYMQAQADRRSE